MIGRVHDELHLSWSNSNKKKNSGKVRLSWTSYIGIVIDYLGSNIYLQHSINKIPWSRFYSTVSCNGIETSVCLKTNNAILDPKNRSIANLENLNIQHLFTNNFEYRRWMSLNRRRSRFCTQKLIFLLF